MSSLPEITEALCVAIATRQDYRVKGLCLQAAAKMGEPRGERVVSAFNRQTAVDLKHWSSVAIERSPFVPSSVRNRLDEWLEEARYADQLTAAGERPRPLLLVGPTRCGKTSSAHALAARLSLPLYRLGLNDVIDSFMGGTSAKLAAAMKELNRPGVWLIDELDAIAMRRQYDQNAGQERAHAVGFLLTALDSLPSGTLLVATTNLSESIDSAVLARFSEVSWPEWQMMPDQAAFVASHGGDTGLYYSSYAEAAEKARRYRVANIIADAKLERGAAE